MTRVNRHKKSYFLLSKNELDAVRIVGTDFHRELNYSVSRSERGGYFPAASLI